MEVEIHESVMIEQEWKSHGFHWVWFKAYTVYQKDPGILGKGLKVIGEDPVKVQKQLES